MALPTLPPVARRPIAAIWFAAFAVLFTVWFFLRLWHGIILYIVLPSVATGIAGCICAEVILDSSHVKMYR